MITELTPQIPLGRDRRLVALLDEREEEVKAYGRATDSLKEAHKEALRRLDGKIYSLRLEIITGQTSLIDAMEVGHAEPASKVNGQ